MKLQTLHLRQQTIFQQVVRTSHINLRPIAGCCYLWMFHRYSCNQSHIFLIYGSGCNHFPTVLLTSKRGYKQSIKHHSVHRWPITTNSVAADSADMVCPQLPPTLTFDRLTMKLVCKSHLRWGTFLSNLGTLGLCILELFAMYAKDGRMDKSNAYCLLPYGRVGGIISLPTSLPAGAS